MCFTRRVKREQKRPKMKPIKIHPEPPPTFTMDEKIIN